MKKTITITMLLLFMVVISCANMSGGEKGALTGAGIGALGGAAITAIAGGNAAVGGRRRRRGRCSGRGYYRWE